MQWQTAIHPEFSIMRGDEMQFHCDELFSLRTSNSTCAKITRMILYSMLRVTFTHVTKYGDIPMKQISILFIAAAATLASGATFAQTKGIRVNENTPNVPGYEMLAAVRAEAMPTAVVLPSGAKAQRTDPKHAHAMILKKDRDGHVHALCADSQDQVLARMNASMFAPYAIK
jgi:hypothetical protein